PGGRAVLRRRRAGAPLRPPGGVPAPPRTAPAAGLGPERGRHGGAALRGGGGAVTRPTDQDLRLLRRTVELSRSCPPSRTAFSVGALVAAADGTVLADGYSRRDDPHDHAEEAALRALAADDPRLA